MNFSFVHEFDIDPKSYWDIFFDEGYNKDLNQALNMRSFKVLDQKDDGQILRRTQRLEPSFNVPGWASSVIKDTAYTEHDTFHRERSSMDVQVEPALMKDRFKLGGTYAVTPLANGRCRREFKGEVKISVPLIGGKLENLMVDQLRASYDIAARVTREWISRRAAR